MTIEELNRQVDEKRGVAGGWPKDITYKAIDETNITKIVISTTENADKKVLKKIDPWGFAFLGEVRNIVCNKSLEMKFSLCNSSVEAFAYESLKRRLSYLAFANDLTITLEKNGISDPLHTMTELTNRPDDEKVRSDFKPRGDDDDAGRLEKDFQTYLFGKGLHNDPEIMKDRTNERLALFGPDFIRVGKIKKNDDRKGYRVEREFPTGAFREKKGNNNRILPTEYVDLVTMNRNGDLSLIELKFDDPKLEVIPQVLNYALFFHAYRRQLTPLIDAKLGYSTAKCNIVTYLISNMFHDKFDKVFPFYAKGPLSLKKVILGYMPELKKS